MTFYTARRRLFGAASSLALIGSLTLGALASSYASTQTTSGQLGLTNLTPPASIADSASSQLTRRFWDELQLESQDAWTKLRDDFQWQNEAMNARVQEWIEYYRSKPENIVEITERARPWIAWITQQVEARGLPGEIALIPFVESSFDPKARSHFGAAGLWQIMPRTGDALGLQRNSAWDGRVDVVKSTKAALDYIEMQADEWYDGDLMLSLAAYNAGAGNVNRARRSAQSRGLGGSYWDLRLPKETMAYVPKLLAISQIINDPEHYGIALPEIDGNAAFAKIALTNPISLAQAATMAGVSTSELAELNPGLKSSTIDPSHSQQLLVPADKAATLREGLASLSSGREAINIAANTSQTGMHVVQHGDTLSKIALKHDLSMTDLARWNGISNPEALQPGQQLTLSGS
uniref:transglycosylase SLT domain-containing protein n=1 Tax=Halomonas sp. TaxID=1486246 RepID=UPI002612B164|nr:transglycosylase SLT domain-containing protein [Halomonas sp.]